MTRDADIVHCRDSVVLPLHAVLLREFTTEGRRALTDRNAEKVRITLATPADRSSIYRLRQAVYATELGQHRLQASAMLSDALDENNFYIMATVADDLAGFISITPPELDR